jgi:hypothetical protein
MLIFAFGILAGALLVNFYVKHKSGMSLLEWGKQAESTDSMLQKKTGFGLTELGKLFGKR